MMYRNIVVPLLAIAVSVHASDEPLPFTTAFQSFIKTHCNECHGGKEPEAGLHLKDLLNESVVDAHPQAWAHVLDRLKRRDMPPKEEVATMPSEAAFKQVVGWLEHEVDRIEFALARNKPTPMRRLNRREYQNTIRDLIGLDLPVADHLPMDDSLHGLDNIADVLNTSSVHINSWLDVADDVMDRAVMTGKQPETRELEFTHKKYPGIAARDGNSYINQDKTKYWVGGPFHVKIPLHQSAWRGTYRVTVRATPHQFNGTIAGFNTTVNGTNRRDWDVRPKDGSPMTIIEWDVPLTSGKGVIEVRWAENHHRFGERDVAGYVEGKSPFRLFQAVKRAMPDASIDDWMKELGWPYFSDLQVTVVGPIHETWPPRATQELLRIGPRDEVDEATLDPRAVVSSFLPRAFRRAARDEEIDQFVSIIQREQDAGVPRLDAIKFGLAAILSSPHFLYLVETPSPGMAKGEYRLNPHELATRLSYFLWSSMPDDKLFEAARTGELLNADVFNAQVQRMLRHPNAKALTDGFGVNWLQAWRAPSLMPEPKFFPNFDEYLHRSIAGEPVNFFDRIRVDNRSILDFLDTDWTMLNGRLARHYDISDVHGVEFRPVSLTDRRRGGVLTQAAYLTMTSEATRTSPIKRGLWVIEQLFNRPPDPPPPGAGDLNIEGDIENMSMRERLDLHRTDSQCAGCHKRFDPYGLALEAFDGIGQLRNRDEVYTWEQVQMPSWKRGKPKVFDINPQVTMEDDTEVDGVIALKSYLRTHRKDDFARGFVEQFYAYALGRKLLVTDRHDVVAITQHVIENKYTFESVINAIVTADGFRSR